jgi:hypothetical protein
MYISMYVCCFKIVLHSTNLRVLGLAISVGHSDDRGHLQLGRLAAAGGNGSPATDRQRGSDVLLS